MARAREADQLGDVSVQPGSGVRQKNLPVLEAIGAGVEAHDLVGPRRRLVLGDASDIIVFEILDQLRARGLVLGSASKIICQKIAQVWTLQLAISTIASTIELASDGERRAWRARRRSSSKRLMRFPCAFVSRRHAPARCGKSRRRRSRWDL